jgi:serine protease Do
MRLVGGRPVVDAMIDGRGPFRLGVETGAAFAALTKSTIDSLHLAPVRTDDMSPIYALDSLALGPARVLGLPVRDVAPADPAIDGILGLGVFESLLLTVDYPAERVILERGTLPAPNGASVLATSRVGPFFAVQLDAAGTPVTAVIDTRSSGSFGFTPAGAGHLRFAAPPVVAGQARGAAIPVTDIKMGRLDGDIALGAVRFQRPIVIVRPLPPGFPDAIMGSVALQNFAMTLDQRRGAVRFARAGSAMIPPPPPVTDLGVRLRQRPGEPPEIGEVRPGTPADSAGIEPGDVVLQAGDMQGATIDPTSWRALAATGKPVALKLKRGSETLEKSVAPVVLVP